MSPSFLLSKSERLNKKKVIDRFFSGQAAAFTIYPFRVLFMHNPAQEAPASMLVSVSKRHFKHAVARNRVKRQVREAFRKHKDLLWPALEGGTDRVAVAFIYLSNEFYSTAQIDEKVQRALQRISEQLSKEKDD